MLMFAKEIQNEAKKVLGFEEKLGETVKIEVEGGVAEVALNTDLQLIEVEIIDYDNCEE